MGTRARKRQGPAVKALTVHQPWASAIIWGGKDVENRTWLTNYRGRLWIHAGLRADPVDVLPPGVTAPRGVILGSVRLVGCLRDSTSSWAIPGQRHWLLADPMPLPEPVPCKGAQGLWSVPGNLHDQITAADG